MGIKQVVQKKHRITIPMEYRKSLGIKEGDEVEIMLERGQIIVVPSWFVANPTERLSGILKGVKAPKELRKELAKVVIKQVEKEMRE